MSRNVYSMFDEDKHVVTSREGRVSRNYDWGEQVNESLVTSREGRVSRNPLVCSLSYTITCHVPRGACE